MPQHCRLVPLPALDKNATGEAKLRALDHVRAFDRRTTLEHVTSHLAHELGSPLNVIEGRAAMLMALSGTGAEIHRNARIIAEQSARMSRLLRDVVTFCRRARVAPTEVDVVQLTESAVALLDRTAIARHATITLDDGGTTGSVYGDPEALLVLVTHLVENGVEATPPGGTLHVTLRRVEASDGSDGAVNGGEICIDVDDDGPELAPEVLPALFEPFTSTHGNREPSGIGLFVAQAIAKDHGGWIEGTRKPEPGARFTLHLPLGDDHAE